MLLTTEQILMESAKSTTTCELGQRICRAQVRKVLEEVSPVIQEALDALHEIRMDWTDPRAECETAAKALVWLRKTLREAGGE